MPNLKLVIDRSSSQHQSVGALFAAGSVIIQLKEGVGHVKDLERKGVYTD
jgi:hypothetical protein